MHRIDPQRNQNPYNGFKGTVEGIYHGRIIPSRKGYPQQYHPSHGRSAGLFQQHRNIHGRDHSCGNNQILQKFVFLRDFPNEIRHQNPHNRPCQCTDDTVKGNSLTIFYIRLHTDHSSNGRKYRHALFPTQQINQQTNGNGNGCFDHTHSDFRQRASPPLVPFPFLCFKNVYTV